MKKILKAKTRAVAVVLACTLVLGMTGCKAKDDSKSVVSDKISYTLTEEANQEIELPNSPISSFWFPAELLAWNSEEDPDFAYNVSAIPLQERVEKDMLSTINTTQNKDTKVMAISIMNSSTSGNAPHGKSKFSANTFSYWQYIDTLVYWGGSAGEGIIVPPSPDVTDAAHKNGVPVLGTVFFPMLEHGGKIEWLDDFLKKDTAGNFLMADKLIEVSDKYGFDGWFINQETQDSLTKNHAVLMQEFIKQCKEKAPEGFQIVWYDSMTKEGEMNWQNALTQENDFFMIDSEKNKVADGMFLNFWWGSDELKNSRERAEQLGIDPYELYAGVDVQANGVMTPVEWRNFENGSASATYTSLGLYCPSWSYFAAETIDAYDKNESRLWVNEHGNPAIDTKVSGSTWKGISTYVVERSVVKKAPFVTNFSMGNGYSFFIDGEKVSNRDWNNRSMADVMPTYRWIMDSEGNNDLKVYTDYANAYYGGNSFRFYGNMDANKNTEIKLFASDLAMEKSMKVSMALKASDKTTVNLVLTMDDGSTKVVKGDKAVSTDWTVVGFDVSKLAGKSVRNISISIAAKEKASGYEFFLGNLSILNGALETTDVTSTKVEGCVFDEENMYAGVRLSYEPSGTKNIKNYEIYRINQDNSKSLLSVTTNPCSYIDRLERSGESLTTTFEVVAVNYEGVRGKGATTSIEWKDNSIPRADFKASTTLIPEGGSVTFESTSTQNTEGLLWEFEGANVTTSEEASPTVTYQKEGTYKVSLTAKNAKGEDKKEIEGFITVNNNAKDGLVNLALNQNAEASAYVNENEAPPFAVDGDYSKKWCATGNPPHTLTIDLGEVKTISQIAIAHAEKGNESPDMNTQKYKFEVSTDGNEFTEIVNITKNKDGMTLDTFKAVDARYVRLVVVKPTQGGDTAARIYEVEVYGINK